MLRMNHRKAALGIAALFFLPLGAFAAPNDWAEGSADKSDGATRLFYNRAAFLDWAHPLGDWHDSKDVGQGDSPYAIASVSREQKGGFVEWDVTNLVEQWQCGTFQNLGFFLRQVDGRGSFAFSSRECPDAAQRPQLVLSSDRGTVTLTPVADTFLDPSTLRSQGHLEVLRVSAKPDNALLRFDSDQIKGSHATKAVLRLFNTTQTSGAGASIGVFRCQEGDYAPDPQPIFGLAARYPRDQGLDKDADVVFSTGFEADDWKNEWSASEGKSAPVTVSSDPAHKFQSWEGKSLSAKLPEGGNTALSLLWKFKQKTGAEPEEMFFRYYLRLGDDWNQTVSGGKLPGLSGTYGKAGWGGRKANGTNGWSARGWFVEVIPDGNPLAGLQPIGSYVYHTDQKTTYGDGVMWTRGYRGLLEKNRWYCIEQQVQLNQPDAHDGVLRAWVDGRLAWEKTDYSFRTTERLKIERLWMDVYHGGTQPSPTDQHLFIDNVVLARKYIGPMAK